MIKDKYFEGKEKINSEKLSENLKNTDKIIYEVRSEISKLFSFSNYLKLQGENKIEEKLMQKIEKINREYKHNYFLKNLFLHNTDPLILSSRYYDKKLKYIKNLISKNEVKIFKKLTTKPNIDQNMLGNMLTKDPGYPEDLRSFSNMKELEEGFIKHIDKFYTILRENIKQIERKNIIHKLGFRYSKRTDTFLKILYIKGSFEQDEKYYKENLFKGKSMQFLLNMLLKTGNKEQIKIFENSSNKNINKLISLNHIISYKLPDGNNADIFEIIASKNELFFNFLVLSIEKNTSWETIYELLKKLYFSQIEQLENTEHILFNFSSYESNILNQLNYYYKHKNPLKYKLKHYYYLDNLPKKLFRNCFEVYVGRILFANITYNKDSIKIQGENFISKKDLRYYYRTPPPQGAEIFRKVGTETINFHEIVLTKNNFIRKNKKLSKGMVYHIVWGENIQNEIYKTIQSFKGYYSPSFSNLKEFDAFRMGGGKRFLLMRDKLSNESRFDLIETKEYSYKEDLEILLGKNEKNG